MSLTARDYALLAQEAYTASPDIGVEASASRAIVRDTAGGLVVAFPGTDNVPCWLADLDILPMTVPGVGDVYRGFWRAWDAIAVDVLAAIGGRPVTLVGHSLGAAIALMAACAMKAGGNAPGAVWGFEPPRVSPSLGVRALLADVPVTLTKKGNDLVPDLPPGGEHGALLTHIGVPLRPWPNIPDHMIAGVIESYPQDA